jgi:hypothetical protein
VGWGSEDLEESTTGDIELTPDEFYIVSHDIHVSAHEQLRRDRLAARIVVLTERSATASLLDATCPVCEEAWRECQTVIMPCKHMVCMVCLATWAMSNARIPCPKCQKRPSVQERQLIHAALGLEDLEDL